VDFAGRLFTLKQFYAQVRQKKNILNVRMKLQQLQ
jgi:hypothetical protein